MGGARDPGRSRGDLGGADLAALVGAVGPLQAKYVRGRLPTRDKKKYEVENERKLNYNRVEKANRKQIDFAGEVLRSWP